MAGWTAEEIVRALLAAGFAKARQGATWHAVYGHGDGRRVIVSMHGGDLRPGTVSAIRRQSKLPFRK